MPDSLVFDGVDDFIRFSPGSADGTGAYTVVVIAKIVDSATFTNFFGFNNIDALFGKMNTDPAEMVVHPGNDPVLSSFTIDSADNWCVFGFSKADGVGQLGRFHRYIYDTTTWTHSAGVQLAGPLPELAACTRIVLGARGDVAGNFFNGNMLIAGWWDSELSDGDIENLADNQQAWVDAAPEEAWRLDTTSTITPFVGTSTEAARTGTTLDPGDAPSGWSDITVGGPVVAWIRA